MGKPLALKRCLLNVIDNGIKYGHRVDVQLIESTQSVDVIVEDHGQGIGNVAVEDLFKPYFRANTEMEGTGLGLTISRSIIRGHGGELIVSKAEAGGLRVVVSFVK
jgi:signal transduction histidine kinase